MKTSAFSFLTFLLLAVAAVADPIQDGSAAFAQGDYAAAARAYETALASGPKSAGLYYNLAMAQLKNGDKPGAAVSLRRSLMLDPRMVDAQMALSELEKSQGIKVPSGWEDKVAEKAPLYPLVIAGCSLAWLGAFLLLFGFFKTGKKALLIVAAVLLVVFGGGLMTTAYLADPLIRQARSGVVSAAAGTTLLAAPADQSAAIAKLSACAPVKILRQSGEWVYCEAADGAKGWTSAKSLTAVLPTS